MLLGKRGGAKECLGVGRMLVLGEDERGHVVVRELRVIIRTV